MRNSQILKKVIYLSAIVLISLSIHSCICKKDKIDVYEGRRLYDEELKVISYEEGDTVRFESDGQIHEFYCTYRKHYYKKGEPVYNSHNECEGQTLMSRDILSVTLKTDLTAYYYQNLKVNRADSINIHIAVESDYFDDAFSDFSISMKGPFYGGALLYLVDNEISYQEDFRPSHTSYDYYDLIYYDSIRLNNTDYGKVICIENHYPINEEIPWYYSKLFYNEEYGILRLERSNGIVYDLITSK